MRLRDAARLALAADTAFITVMEIVDNAIMRACVAGNPGPCPMS
jgi:hypothetical protein